LIIGGSLINRLRIDARYYFASKLVAQLLREILFECMLLFWSVRSTLDDHIGFVEQLTHAFLIRLIEPDLSDVNRKSCWGKPYHADMDTPETWLGREGSLKLLERFTESLIQ